MPIVKHFRDRGANVTVTAAAEVLFMPGGDVHGWTRRFGNQIKKWTEQAAPTNKRPRWAHYGAPLKRTIISRPVRFRQFGPDTFRVYGTVGSNSPHAYYVDQGTGVYAGKGPYQAKILPPWTRQSPSLYEHTWKVPRSAGINDHGEKVVEWEEVGTVQVKGQKGQHFFKAGLDRAFLFMVRSGQRSAAGKTGKVPLIDQALNELPHGMDDFSGATPASGAFIASLEEWRSWRDRAWYAGQVLGQGINKERTRRAAEAEHKTSMTHRQGGETMTDFENRMRGGTHNARYYAAQRAQRYRDRKKAQRAALEHAEAMKRAEMRKRAREDKAIDKAAIRRRLMAQIAAERATLLADAQAKYTGARVEVKGPSKHLGTYSFHVFVTKNGRTVDFWFPSDYQAPR